MTKKDFQLIADVLASQRRSMSDPRIDDVAREFARVLMRTNPRFDRNRFIAATQLSL